MFIRATQKIGWLQNDEPETRIFFPFSSAKDRIWSSKINVYTLIFDERCKTQSYRGSRTTEKHRVMRVLPFKSRQEAQLQQQN